MSECECISVCQRKNDCVRACVRVCVKVRMIVSECEHGRMCVRVRMIVSECECVRV